MLRPEKKSGKGLASRFVRAFNTTSSRSSPMASSNETYMATDSSGSPNKDEA